MQSQPALTADAPAAVRPCAHCGAAGTTRYCGDCGRPRDAATDAKTGLLRESVAEVLGMEHGLLGTVRDLLIRPVKVFQAYLHGNADGYVRPLKMFFVLAGAYMLLLSLVKPLTFDMQLLLNQSNPDWGKAVADLIQRRGLTQEILNARFEARMNTATPLVIAVALLPMAALLKLMRRERPYAEHVMFMLTFSNCVWLLSIATLPLLPLLSDWGGIAVQALSYIYVGIGFFAFYWSGTRMRTSLKFAGYVVADFTLTFAVGIALAAGVLLSVLYW
jgi:Protein of unknown function (DUF3667)